MYTAPVSFWWDGGSSHALFAPTPQDTGPHTRWNFTHWADGPTTQSRVVTVTAPTNYTAVYAYEYKIVIDTNPTGFTLTVDGTTVVAPYSAFFDAGTSIAVRTPDLVPEGAGRRYSFLGWTDGSASPATTIIVDRDKTVVALYAHQFLLTVTTDTGTVLPASGWYDEGAVVAISVTPPPGNATDRYVFGGWTGDCTGTTCVITMDGPKSVHAAWIHEFRIDVGSTIPGQTIQADSTGVVTPASLWWAQGSSHTLQAPAGVTLSEDTRANFASWTGGETSPVLDIVSVSGPATYTASYTRQFRVTVVTDPVGRTVLVDGMAYTGPAWFDEGTVHTFDAGASPQIGATGVRYAFRHWDAGSTTARRTTAIAAPTAMTATFDAQYRLTITSPFGDPRCEGSADAEGCWYLAGSRATVVVTSPFDAPDGRTYVVTGWSGDAGGTNASASVEMDAPRTVVASWQVVLPEAPAPPIGLIAALVGTGIAAAAGAGLTLYKWRARVPSRNKSEARKPPPG